MQEFGTDVTSELLQTQNRHFSAPHFALALGPLFCRGLGAWGGVGYTNACGVGVGLKSHIPFST